MRPLLLLFTALCFFAPSSHAENDAPKRPRVGVALGGGGARGAAHIGVLKVLQENGVPIDCIAGTSMGAIVGGLYASGLSVNEIEQLFIKLDWSEGFRDRAKRQDLSFRRKQDDQKYLVQFDLGWRDGEFSLPRGLVQGEQLNMVLKTLTQRAHTVHDFDQLRIPFRAVAADLISGETVVIKDGDLADAVRASMSIPGVYEPIERDGHLLIDGGVANNLPIDVVRGMCADIVIAVDVSSPLLNRDELASVVDVVDQLSTMLTRRNSEASIASLRAGDVLFRPDLSDIGASDFNKVADAIARGIATAEAHPELSQLITDRTGKTGTEGIAMTATQPIVKSVSLDNSSRLATNNILERISQPLGEPFELNRLHSDLEELFGTGFFGVLNYELAGDLNEVDLKITTPENPLGPHLFRFDVQLEDDLSGDSVYSLGVRHTFMPANESGGEWRNELQIGSHPRLASEWFQPFSRDGRWFVSSSAEFERRIVKLQANDTVYGELAYTGSLYRAEFGHQFGGHGHALIGVRKGDGRLTEHVGDFGLQPIPVDVGERYFFSGIDKLDHRYFPRRGRAGSVTYARGSEKLGADDDYQKISFDWLEVKSWGRHSLSAQWFNGNFIHGEAPVQEQYQLGGLFRLSGFNKNELSGRHLRLFNLYYLYRMDNEISATLDTPVYFGMTAERGNVWNDNSDDHYRDYISAASAFLGIDTQFGPFYLAYGRNSEHRDALYLYLGAPF